MNGLSSIIETMASHLLSFFVFLISPPKKSDNRQAGPKRHTIKKTQTLNKNLPTSGLAKNTIPANTAPKSGASGNADNLSMVVCIKPPSRYRFFCAFPNDPTLLKSPMKPATCQVRTWGVHEGPEPPLQWLIPGDHSDLEF